VALLAGVVGLAAVLAVQTRAKAELARSLARETDANRALGVANAELGRSKAAVQARYDLAVDAIRTFHTGVGEDFLLEQDQFKGLRDRLLNSASDFYGKFGALLVGESDVASRRPGPRLFSPDGVDSIGPFARDGKRFRPELAGRSRGAVKRGARGDAPGLTGVATRGIRGMSTSAKEQVGRLDRVQKMLMNPFSTSFQTPSALCRNCDPCDSSQPRYKTSLSTSGSHADSAADTTFVTRPEEDTPDRSIDCDSRS
jgi:hypothetical protein